MSANFPDTETPEARRGTVGHYVAELLLNDRQPGDMAGTPPYRWDKSQAPEWMSHYEDFEDIEYDLLGGYVDYVYEQMGKNSILHVEVKVDYSAYVDGGFGTSDVCILTPSVLDVIDLKFGRVLVEAKDNPQLKLYGLGALEHFYFMYPNIRKVRTHIVQPLLGYIGVEEYKPSELRAFGDVARNAAIEARRPNPRLRPGEKQCAYCPAKAVCKARAEHNMRSTQILLSGPIEGENALSTEELGELALKFPEIKRWMAAIDDHLVDRMSAGEAVPTHKMVESRTKRCIPDQDAAITFFRSLFPPEAFLTQKLKGIGELEKLLGGPKAARENLDFQSLIYRPEGKPQLALANDPREAFEPCLAKEFGVFNG